METRNSPTAQCKHGICAALCEECYAPPDPFGGPDMSAPEVRDTLDDDLSDGVPVLREDLPFAAVGAEAITGRFTKPRVLRAS